MKFTDSFLKYKKVCGIYKIICLSSNSFYIGSSKNIQQRFFKHRNELRKSVHKNEHLQNAYNKYLEENFSIEIVELCSEEEQFSREQYYIDFLKPNFNKQIDVIDRKTTQKTKNKLSKSMKKYLSKEENLNKRYKTFYCFDKNLNLINTYKGIKPSLKEISNFLNCSEKTIIKGLSNCLNNKAITYKGYYWSYNKNFTPKKAKPSKKFEPVKQLDLENKLIKIWDCSRELKKAGFTIDGICHAIKSDSHFHKGYLWKR